MTYIDELKELKQLLDDGILTQEEFSAQKSHLLESSKEIVNADPTSNSIESEGHEKKVEVFDKNKCASCGAKIGVMTRFKLKDNHFICANCIKKAGLTTSPSNQEFIKQNVTLDTLFGDHDKTKSSQPTINKIIAPVVDKHAIKCPKCKSTDVVFMQQGKKGFSVGKAVGGAVLTGGIGTLAGFAGKKGKKQWHCNNCGRVFETKK
ncbi:SHOCT domain-containing protein [Lactococcus cremoris]|uniref:SHOCT domain-containing protein n=1 Tax=Lactococcus lactis subsp. cremoris TaxID=1359 RepID=UPI0019651C1E|nr:SHOCT domain-containing protein [Lactococcus cremoris]QRZ33200.1 SHOCT domain-containing protein [Lactococcus cremoris]